MRQHGWWKSQSSTRRTTRRPTRLSLLASASRWSSYRRSCWHRLRCRLPQVRLLRRPRAGGRKRCPSPSRLCYYRPQSSRLHRTCWRTRCDRWQRRQPPVSTSGSRPTSPNFLCWHDPRPKGESQNTGGGLCRVGVAVLAVWFVRVGVDGHGWPTNHSADTSQSSPASHHIGVDPAFHVETHPEEAPSLFSYIIIITDLQTRHGGFAWRVYAERFRRVRAMAPQMPWHITNWDLAMGAIQSNVSFVRQGAPPTQSPFRNGRRPDARDLCNDFNYRGKCARQQCRLAHVCNVCGRSGHSGRTCRAAQPAPRKGRAGFAVAGARPPPCHYLLGYKKVLRDTLVKGFVMLSDLWLNLFLVL